MQSYETEFETAVAQTLPKLGFPPTKISLNQGGTEYFGQPLDWQDLLRRALTGSHVAAFRPQIEREGYYLSPQRRKNNCCALHSIACAGLQTELKATAAFTVGYVTLPDGRNKFQTSLRQLAEMIRAVSGTQTTFKHVALHAWLTFDSGEILDMTIGPTLHAQGEAGFQEAEIIAGKPQTIAKLSYHPVAVGLGLVMKLNLLTT